MENKKQLAVDWLWNQIVNAGKTNYTDLLVVAKQMEQEQRIKDYNAGYQDGQCNHINDAENYVNEQNYLSNE